MKFPTVMLCCLLLLTACSQIPVVSVSDEQQQKHWQQRQRKLQQLNNWVATGRVAITTSEEGWNATLYWKQLPEGFEIKIIAPFGQGTVMLRGDSSGVMLYLDDEPPEHAANASILLARRLGWHVPVESLRYWMLGLPDPNVNRRDSLITLDSHSRLTDLTQSGWQTQFLRYQQVNGYKLPDKIFLSNGKISVRVVVQQWKLNS